MRNVTEALFGRSIGMTKTVPRGTNITDPAGALIIWAPSFTLN
jgi:hypothetical protein